MSVLVERQELPVFSQPAEELASRSLETKRVPDPYYFLVDQDGDLFSPSARLKVKKVIRTDSKVGVLEARACDFSARWARNAESGTIVWVSPPEPGIYPVSKIIISEIEKVNKVKRVFNRAIVLDIGAIECVHLGQRLAGYSTNQPFLGHPDQLRSTPLILDTTNKTWLEIMEEVIPDHLLWESVGRGDEIIAKQEALEQAEGIYIRYSSGNSYNLKQEEQRMLGDKSESCPPGTSSGIGQTAFQAFSSHSLEADSMGSLYFPCPACGFTNKRPREGYVESCQNPACTDPTKVRC